LGVGLIAAIIITTLLTSLVIVMATQGWTNSNMNALVASEQKAYYAAEAGIEFALRRSMDLSNWNWSLSGNFADGTVDMVVTKLGGDSVQIVSTGVVGISAKRNMLIANIVDLSTYAVNIGGNTSGWFWTPDPTIVATSSPNMPMMDLDSMRTVSQAQGHYHAGNYTIGTAITAWDFWSNPGNHDEDATIIWVEGDLTFPWANFRSKGIFVVMGDVRISGIGEIYGIIYCPNTVTTSLVYTTLITWTNIYGAVFGNTDITGAFLGIVTVFYNAAYVDKFFTYAINEEFIEVDRLAWTAVY
jgi:hypothetical protein